MRKTKIICTLGPSVDNVDAMTRLLRAGMNGARFNFSHGTHDTQRLTFGRLREACKATGLYPALILDTKGPEIRIKSFAGGPVELSAGDTFTLCTGEVAGDACQVSVTYAGLADDLKPGNIILIDDGLVSMKVDSIENGRIKCVVQNGGRLSNQKSINIPGAAINLPALAERDVEDLRFASENRFDCVAASFVRSADDVKTIRSALESFGGKGIKIISKIENNQGVDRLDEIIAASDGVMVARGDLGVEIPAEKVPIIQKEIIRKCREAGKMVIVATQMLDSMIHNPRPTRAEVSDVANAVYDGASCVMLSGETAGGKYPFESLRIMSNIVSEAENAINWWERFRHEGAHTPDFSVSDAITHTCCLTAMDLGAAAILTATQSGYTAEMISRFRPQCPIIALTPDPRVRPQLSLAWGVTAYESREFDSTDSLFAACVDTAVANGIVHGGDTVVITAGVPIGKTGSTNLIKAQLIE